jgi:hypothetical protein
MDDRCNLKMLMIIAQIETDISLEPTCQYLMTWFF